MEGAPQGETHDEDNDQGNDKREDHDSLQEARRWADAKLESLCHFINMAVRCELVCSQTAFV
jgi:hypothetical protein